MRTTFQFRPTEAEYFEALQHNQRGLLQRSRNSWHTLAFFALSLAVWIGIGYCLVALAGQGATIGWWLLSLVLAAPVLAALEQYVKGRNALRWAASQLAHSSTLTIGEDGLRFEGENSDAVIRWQAIHGIETCGSHLLVYLNGVAFILVPSSAFTDEAERNALAECIRSHLGKTADVGADEVTSVTVPASEDPPAGALKNLTANLALGLRLAVFLRPSANTPRVSWSQFILLALMGVALPVAVEMARIGVRGSFAWYALPAALFFLPVMIFGAWAIAFFAGQAQRTLVVLTVMASVALPLGMVDLLLRIVTDSGLMELPRRWSYFAYYLSPLWLAAASAVAAIRILGIARRQWAGAFVLAALLIALPLSSVFHGSNLWVEPYDEAAEERNNRRYRSLSNEDAFYLQPKLLEQQLVDLQPGRKGIIDLYFVGVAGYSRQDVFMKEVQTVSALFKDKFDTNGRTVMMINNPKTVTEIPIASGTGLKRVLRRIADVMDRDEDILFLFLTSHGSKDHKFSLDFWPMRFNNLDPKRLREILDESGIQRRVIVVSACYSGGFLDALKDDNSLVIAAAAPDKNSFGCSNEAELTYFGKAYFDEALRQTYSFVEAFEIAKPRIAERERKDNHDSSDPRIDVGVAIQEPLNALVKQLGSPRPPMAFAANTRKRDVYDTYFDLVELDRRVGQYRHECLREMKKVSPATQIANNPDAYGGITQNSPYWPQLVAAWLEYAESWCKATNDEWGYRQSFRQAWQAKASTADIQAFIDLLRTPLGRKFLVTEEDVSRMAYSKLGDMRAEITQPAVRRLQQEHARIIALHQRGAAENEPGAKPQ